MLPKHTSAGLSPEHHPRKSGMGGDGKGQKNESENQDLSMAPGLMTRLVLKKSQLEMAGRKAQTAYLMVQHADNLREKAERKILLGGSCKIVPNASPPKEHGPQLETQTESRERFIKELAKRAGFSFPGSTIRTLRFFSPNQRWLHVSSVADHDGTTVATLQTVHFTKNKQHADKLKKKPCVNNREETIWDRIFEAFGDCLYGTGQLVCHWRWSWLFENKGKYDRVAHATRLLSLWR